MKRGTHNRRGEFNQFDLVHGFAFERLPSGAGGFVEAKAIRAMLRRYPDGHLESHASESWLPLAPSLKEVNHSPTGFEWGYGGSGPHQLAFAILLDLGFEAGTCHRLYAEFCRQLIASAPRGNWCITDRFVREWVNQQLARRAEKEATTTATV